MKHINLTKSLAIDDSVATVIVMKNHVTYSKGGSISEKIDLIGYPLNRPNIVASICKIQIAISEVLNFVSGVWRLPTIIIKTNSSIIDPDITDLMMPPAHPLARG